MAGCPIKKRLGKVQKFEARNAHELCRHCGTGGKAPDSFRVFQCRNRIFNANLLPLTSLREPLGLIACHCFMRVMFDPDLHRTLTHFQKKGVPCLGGFASFCSNHMPNNPFSKIFAMIFYLIFYKFDPYVVFFLVFWCFFWGEAKWDHVYRFFM